MLPTYEQITVLHKKYAPSQAAYDLVFTHCQIVRDIALQLVAARGLDIDGPLVSAGAMLHDIGVYPLLNADATLKPTANYITHGVEGSRLLEQENMVGSLCAIASHHTGVGITKQDITNQQLPLPLDDYVARNDEELLVMYADKFHSKSAPPHFNSYGWYRQDIARFGADKVTAFEGMAAKFGKPDLQQLQSTYRFAIR